jgi:hypothetical protein
MQCCCVILSFVACPALLYLSTLSHNRHDFRKKLQKMCDLIYYTNLPQIFLTLRRTERDMIKNLYKYACKVPINLIVCWWNLDFLNIYSKNDQISNFMKIRPVGAELLHADGRTDERIDVMTLTVAFRNFANATKRCYSSSRPARINALTFSNAERVWNVSLAFNSIRNF